MTILLTNIVYHSQTNESSERFNQTVKITIKYFIIIYLDIDWWQALPSLQAQFNNSFNVVIEIFSNKMKYDFKVNEAISLLQHETKQFITDLFEKRLKYRVEIANVTVFVNAKIKIYYDAKHQSLMLKFGNRAYLRLNQKYHLFGKLNKKISSQRCGPFLIKKKIERFVYLLKLPFRWRIHSIIFVI